MLIKVLPAFFSLIFISNKDIFIMFSKHYILVNSLDFLPNLKKCFIHLKLRLIDNN